MTGPRHNKTFLIRPESNMHVQKRRRSNTLVPRKMIMQKTRFSHDRHVFSIILESGEDTTLCTRDTINYLTSETDTTRRGAWRKMESGELTIILILQAFMRGSLGQELAEK